MTTRSILLVEDNPDDVELLLRALRKNDVTERVVVAWDGEEALRTLETLMPTLVLLDLRLPGVPGLEVLRRLRAAERTRYLPVVVLTTSSEASDLLDSYRLGANSYVRKSIDFEAFTQVARHIGDYWLKVNQSPPPPSQ